MKIDIKKGITMISKKKLIEVVKDIEAIRSGNYIALQWNFSFYILFVNT